MPADERTLNVGLGNQFPTLEFQLFSEDETLLSPKKWAETRNGAIVALIKSSNAASPKKSEVGVHKWWN